MITMNELVDLRMQQHIAHEIYRQQIMQRIPDPFPPLLPIPMPRHVIVPPRITLPGVDVNLQNDDLWKQFHQIGTEMIITKSGRRMFPSMRLLVSGLEEESNYCILLEMVPIGDCRYKFSGSQWVPAGGAEPQSPQRMFLHPDSPASGAHWQAQPILFNKVKLTNNTLDSNGHIVLASMHKYQPRIHVIHTSDFAQIPWAPQQAFVFPETEFVAVTAYQNDRITKLKIDNNPFAKGFRETGQSRCKRKMSSSPSADDQQQQQQQQQHHNQQPQSDMSPTKSNVTIVSDSGSSICSDKLHIIEQEQRAKRMRSNGSACSISSLDETCVAGVSAHSVFGTGNRSPHKTSSPNAPNELCTVMQAPQASNTSNNNYSNYNPLNAVGYANMNEHGNGGMIGGVSAGATSSFMHHFQQNMQTLLRPSIVDLACSYFGRPQSIYPQNLYPHNAPLITDRHRAGGISELESEAASASAASLAAMRLMQQQQQHNLPDEIPLPAIQLPNCIVEVVNNSPPPPSPPSDDVDVTSESSLLEELPAMQENCNTNTTSPPSKKNGFSISAILGGNS